MRRLLPLAILITALLIAACRPVDDDGVIVVTATPDPTPTREPGLDNPHSDCAADAQDITECLVSPLNSFDVSEPGLRGDDSLYVDGRPFMTVCGVDAANGLCFQTDYTLSSTGNIPFTYCQEQHDGCQMEIHFWDGAAGYCQYLPVIYPGQPYLIKVTYDWDLARAPGQDIEIAARVRNDQYQYVNLPGQPLNPSGETVWAIRTNASQPDLQVCVNARVQWPVFGGDSKLYWHEFGIYALPEDYDGAVIDY